MDTPGHHPLAELLARKLSGIESVPPKEQTRMVNRAIRAAVQWYEADTAQTSCPDRARPTLSSRP
jgi:hypothetical protein